MLFDVLVPLVTGSKVTLTDDTSRGLEVSREHTTRCTTQLADYAVGQKLTDRGYTSGPQKSVQDQLNTLNAVEPGAVASTKERWAWLGRAVERGEEGEAGFLSFVGICSCWVNEAVEARRSPRAPLYSPRRTLIVACHSKTILPTFSLDWPTPLTYAQPVQQCLARKDSSDKSNDAEKSVASAARSFRTLTISRPKAHSMVQQNPTDDSKHAEAVDAWYPGVMKRDSKVEERKAELQRYDHKFTTLDRACDAINGTHDTVVKGNTSTGSMARAAVAGSDGDCANLSGRIRT